MGGGGGDNSGGGDRSGAAAGSGPGVGKRVRANSNTRISMVTAIDDAVQRSLWDRSVTIDQLWPVLSDQPASSSSADPATWLEGFTPRGEAGSPAGPGTVAVPASGELWPATPHESAGNSAVVGADMALWPPTPRDTPRGVAVPESGELWPATPRETPREDGSNNG